MFNKWIRKPGSNLRSNYTKDSKKWYLIPLCLTLSIIWINAKWINPGKWLALSSTIGVAAIQKGDFRSPCTNGHKIYLYI